MTEKESCQKLKRSIKIRLYLTVEQLELCHKSFGASRWIYNRALWLKKNRYDDHKQNLSWVEISKMVTFWKKTDELSWLREPPRSVLEHSLKNLEKAYKGFFRDGKGFPKYKKKSEYQSFVLSDPSRLIGDDRIKLPKIGIVKIKGLRNFEGEIKNVTVSKTPDGKIYASFSVEDVSRAIREKPIAESKKLSIDVNLENYLTAKNSDGVITRIENPRFKKEFFDKIKYYQRRMAKCSKGSKTYHTWRKKIAILYQRINNLKAEFLHQMTNLIIKNHDIIFVEDLKIKNMVKNHKLAEAISMVAWGEFFRQLKYKAEARGAVYLKLNPKNTSKKCSTLECGFINKDLTLSDREWTCPCCKITHDRDDNSTDNLMFAGEGIVRKDIGETGITRLEEFGNYLKLA